MLPCITQKKQYLATFQKITKTHVNVSISLSKNLSNYAEQRFLIIIEKNFLKILLSTKGMPKNHCNFQTFANY